MFPRRTPTSYSSSKKNRHTVDDRTNPVEAKRAEILSKHQEIMTAITTRQLRHLATMSLSTVKQTKISFSSPSAPAHEFSLSRRFGQDCPVLFQGTFEQRNCDEKLKVKKRKNGTKSKTKYKTSGQRKLVCWCWGRAERLTWPSKNPKNQTKILVQVFIYQITSRWM